MCVKAAKSAGVSAKGFTLAEVLVTIVIIGVLSALTIIVFNSGAQTQQQKMAYKIAFTRAKQAWTKMNASNMIVSQSSWYDNNGSALNFSAFKKQFKVVRDCSNNNNSDCWASGELFYSSPNSSTPAFIDASGMAWTLEINGSSIMVDTNGTAGPNKYGRDRFVFDPLPNQSIVNNIPWSTWSNNPYLPVQFTEPYNDYIAPDSNICPSGNCYYLSWLQ